jgi:hypothetical protein
MPVIVVTRLRLRDPALLDEFFASAVAAMEQAQKSDGNLRADALADANNAWWTVSAWQDRGLMRAFVRKEPHLSTMERLDCIRARVQPVIDERQVPRLPQGRGTCRSHRVRVAVAPTAAGARAPIGPRVISCHA